METPQVDRGELYKDPDVQRFLVEFINKGGEIVPTFDLAHGYHYPDVEDSLKQGF
ncbi:MAG: hypothetical protein ACE5OO_01050 [Candidatus Bathyarchaeia archaeon]